MATVLAGSETCATTPLGHFDLYLGAPFQDTSDQQPAFLRAHLRSSWRAGRADYSETSAK